MLIVFEKATEFDVLQRPLGNPDLMYHSTSGRRETGRYIIMFGDNNALCLGHPCPSLIRDPGSSA